jgi:hypothetical protein
MVVKNANTISQILQFMILKSINYFESGEYNVKINELFFKGYTPCFHFIILFYPTYFNESSIATLPQLA